MFQTQNRSESDLVAGNFAPLQNQSGLCTPEEPAIGVTGKLDVLSADGRNPGIQIEHKDRGCASPKLCTIAESMTWRRTCAAYLTLRFWDDLASSSLPRLAHRRGSVPRRPRSRESQIG